MSRAEMARKDEIIGARKVQARLGLSHRNSVYTLRTRFTRPHVPPELRFPDTWADDPDVKGWHAEEIDAWQERRAAWLASRRRQSTEDAGGKCMSDTSANSPSSLGSGT